jgi:glycosyltransferase involved in cell wall biosynthesis
LGRTADSGLSPFAGGRLDRADREEHDLSNPITAGQRDVAGNSSVRSFGMLSTFPPTACGIATFAAALAAGLVAHGATVDVVRCGTAPALEDPLVVASLGDGSATQRAACDALNATDVVIVQHEYGIYAGPDGDAVLGLMEAITVPVMLIAHTVVSDPSVGQRLVLERACARAEVVVVMTVTARERLLAGFRVDADKVIVIPHGAATPRAMASDGAVSDSSRGRPHRPRLLTWGLLGPGKGIEWAIDAFAALDDLDPAPTYMIAGATHPRVRQRSGESYRAMLLDRAERSGSGSAIIFDDSYRDLESLTDQVTSGVLVDAVAAGCPVVSTAFPHAVELLASGAGIVVPQRDSAALSSAIRAVLSDPERARAMAAEARRLAPELSWAAVSARYDAVGAGLVRDHLLAGPVPV